MIKQDNAFLNRLINWQGGGGLKLFKKVVLLSALEWKGISNKVTFESNRGIESFIMFERENMPKMWDRRVTSHFWGDLLHSKRLTPTVTLSPTNIQILLLRFPLRWFFTMVGRAARLAKCFSQPNLLCQPCFIKEPNLSAHQNFWQIKHPDIQPCIHKSCVKVSSDLRRVFKPDLRSTK